MGDREQATLVARMRELLSSTDEALDVVTRTKGAS